jgi:hypothetical protein
MQNTRGVLACTQPSVLYVLELARPSTRSLATAQLTAKPGDRTTDPSNDAKANGDSSEASFLTPLFFFLVRMHPLVLREHGCALTVKTQRIKRQVQQFSRAHAPLQCSGVTQCAALSRMQPLLLIVQAFPSTLEVRKQPMPANSSFKHVPP